MPSPQHKVTLFPIRLRSSDGATDAIERLRRDYPGVSMGLFSDHPQLALDLSADVISISTRKMMTLSSAGTFSISMVDRKRYGLDWRTQGGTKVSHADNIQTNDLMLIQFHAGNKADSFTNVMLGVVIRVSRETRVSGDKVEHLINIEGSDLTHWLLAHRVFFWFYAIGPNGFTVQGIKEAKRRFDSDKSIFEFFLPDATMVPADEVLRNILEGYIGAQLPWVKSTVRLVPQETQSASSDGSTAIGFGESYVPLPDHSLDGFYGSVSQLLERFAFKPFCELWGDVSFDTNPLRFDVHFRRTPFDRQDWYSFTPNDSVRRLHVFTDAQVAGLDAGKSEEELVNFISVLPQIIKAGETDIVRLVMDHTYRIDWTSIKDRGYRPMIISTEYLDYILKGNQSCQVDLTEKSIGQIIGDDLDFQLTGTNKQICASTSEHELQKFKNGKGLMAERADSWVQTLWNWFSFQDRLWAGKLRIAGNPAIRVGHKITLMNDTKKNFEIPMDFYVAGVTHAYDVEGGSFLTTLNLTRGQSSLFMAEPSTDGKADKAQAEAAKNAGKIEQTNTGGQVSITKLGVGWRPVNDQGNFR